MRLSVIVVSYNTRELLRRCLASLGDDHEVIVVDNASSDGSASMVRDEFPRVLLVENAENLGFGAANNQGLDAMGGELALLLNSDALATKGSIECLLKVMDDPAIVACGGRLLDPSVTDIVHYTDYVQELAEGRGLIGTEVSLQQRWKQALDLSTQASCANALSLWAVFCEQSGLEKLFPHSRLLSPYWETARILSTVTPEVMRQGAPVYIVEQVMGACLLMRPLERFDERFFLYCEDTELCRRLRRHGSIAYAPMACFGHELGGSSTKERWKSVARYNRGKELYFKIHHGPVASAACWLLDRCGALLRVLGSLVLNVLTLGNKPGLRQKLGTFWRVLLAPVAGPPRP